MQVKIKLSHHSISDGNVSSDKQLVFVMDPPRDEDADGGGGKKRKKKGKKDVLTAKNFGAKISPDKMKATNRFKIGWRLRFPGENYSF